MKNYSSERIWVLSSSKQRKTGEVEIGVALKAGLGSFNLAVIGFHQTSRRILKADLADFADFES